MVRHFPYLSAVVTTAAVGAITSVVWAAQVPVLHPGVTTLHPAVAVGGPTIPPRPVVAQPTVAQPNTPGTGALQLPPGFQQAATYGRPGMSQAGQPPFGEMLYSMQTYMNQPGMPDYYDRLGINPTALQASEGVTPLTSYLGQVGTQVTETNTTTTTTATTPPNSLGQHLTPTNTGSTVGFYQGFGPGSPNFGFYAGFTTPR
jgi:hypothetical protein